jgi:hypothetical protein
MSKMKDVAIDKMEEMEMAEFPPASDTVFGIHGEHFFHDETPDVRTPNEIESAAHEVEGIFTTYDEYEIIELLSPDVKERMFNALLEYMDV